MSTLDLPALVIEYDIAQAYSLGLVDGLAAEQISWRPDQNSSAMGWHLGHQGAVNHFMVRNLTAAEPSVNVDFDAVFDSATPEPARGALPNADAIIEYRKAIASSTHKTVNRIADGDVGAPQQLRLVAAAMMVTIINHEYQHAQWIGEVRSTFTDAPAPKPETSNVVEVDGYYMVG